MSYNLLSLNGQSVWDEKKNTAKFLLHNKLECMLWIFLILEENNKIAYSYIVYLNLHHQTTSNHDVATTKAINKILDNCICPDNFHDWVRTKNILTNCMHVFDISSLI